MQGFLVTDSQPRQTSTSLRPVTKTLVPLPDGGMIENGSEWPPDAKTVQQRTLELLEEGYVLTTTRVDGTRLFRLSD